MLLSELQELVEDGYLFVIINGVKCEIDSLIESDEFTILLSGHEEQDKKFEKYFSENLSKCITHPPDTEIAEPADLYPPDNIERAFHLTLPIQPVHQIEQTLYICYSVGSISTGHIILQRTEHQPAYYMRKNKINQCLTIGYLQSIVWTEHQCSIKDKTMKRKEIETKYAKVLRQLHTCRPCEKAGLKTLLNYYYNLLQQ